MSDCCLACGHAAHHASWCGPDYLAQDRVSIFFIPTETVPEHILNKLMLGAYRDPDLAAAKRWQPSKGDVSPTTAEEREWVHGRIIALTAEREARGDAHRERIRTTAAWLGDQVRTHKVTLADADRRIDCLLEVLDPETDVPILLVPFGEAKQIAADAFKATFKGHAP
jgi:hypothetical protein